MSCASCGSADVAVRRDEDVYCSACAVVRDWHEVIEIAQGSIADAAADPGEVPSQGAGHPRAEAVASGTVVRAPADPFA